MSSSFSAGCDGSVWYLGQSGDALTTTPVECGNLSSPCHHLSELSHLLRYNDSVLILPSETPLEHCMDVPLTTAINIAPYGTTPTLQCTNTSGEYGKILFLLARPSQDIASIQGLRFHKGFVHAANIRLTFQNCTFGDATVVMASEAPWTKPDLSELPRRLLIDNQMPCSSAEFVLLGTRFEQPTHKERKSMTEALSPEFDIYLYCVDLMIYVKDSFFGGRRFRLSTMRQLFMVVNGTSFHGNKQDTKIGGITLEFFGLSSIVSIVDTDFRDLMPKSVLHGVLYEKYFKLAPVNIIIPEHVLCEHVGLFHKIFIDGCVFHGNQGGLKVNRCPWEVNILNTLFQDNCAVFDGGALSFLDSNGVSKFNIINSTFIENSAGCFRKYPVTRSTSSLYLDKLNVTITNFNLVQGTTGVLEYEFESGSKNGVITEELHGRGGAIFSRDGSLVIENCTFIDNEASQLGGAIMLLGTSKSFGQFPGAMRTPVNTDIRFSNFVLTSRHTVQETNGDMLFSHRVKVTLHEAKFDVQGKSGTGSLFHYTGGVGSMLQLGNFRLTCPLNHKIDAAIEIKEKSIDRGDPLTEALGIADKITRPTNPPFQVHDPFQPGFPGGGPNARETGRPTDVQMIAYTSLTYNCPACKDSYSLEAGAVQTIEGQPTPNYTAIECLPCPYGGNCKDGLLTATPNFWGARVGNEVGFYHCPDNYCCSSSKCSSFDECADKRTGILCGKCEVGFSEALFSQTCVADADCTSAWLILAIIISAVVYAFFLTYQGDLQDLILGIKTSAVKDNKRLSENRGKALNVCLPTVSNGRPLGPVGLTDGGSGDLEDNYLEDVEKITKEVGSSDFIILLFYYFQDSALFKVVTVYSSGVLINLGQYDTLISSLSQFDLEFFELALGNLCIFPGLDMVSKLLYKMVFVPLLLFVLLLFYLGAFSRRATGKRNGTLFKILAALMLAILFSYQKLALSTFSLLHCVPVHNSLILFVNGSIQCYQTWQYVLFVYMAVSIVPFCVLLMFGPSLLKEGLISCKEFIVSSLIPLPFILTWPFRLWTKRKSVNVEATPVGPQAGVIYDVLQGSCRDFRIARLSISMCWAGVLVALRSCLILAYTFIIDPLWRLSVMFFVVQLSLVLQVKIWPYTKTADNIAATLSGVALLVVAFVNLIRAAFEDAQYIPEGPSHVFMNVGEVVESILLVWLPVVAASLIVLAVLYRLIHLVYNGIKKIRKSSRVTSNEISNREANLSTKDLPGTSKKYLNQTHM